MSMSVPEPSPDQHQPATLWRTRKPNPKTHHLPVTPDCVPGTPPAWHTCMTPPALQLSAGHAMMVLSAVCLPYPLPCRSYLYGPPKSEFLITAANQADNFVRMQIVPMPL